MPIALRKFESQVQQKTKGIIVGIDFGTSFTKVYFNQEGEVKEPLQFCVNGVNTYFLPTKLYYEPTNNKLYYKEKKGAETISYFKYSMINKNLIKNKNMSRNNADLQIIPEVLCSVYFLSCLLKEVRNKVAERLKTNDINFTSFNMGVPIDNFRDKNKGEFDKVLTVAFLLSTNDYCDGYDLNSLNDFYQMYKDEKTKILQTVPELYAEALWFIEQPSTREGLYTILDIGGGTVDFATIYISRIKGEKKTSIYSQNVIPFGIEILVQYMFPSEYKTEEDCIEHLSNDIVKMPYGIISADLKDKKIRKAHEFDKSFAKGIGEVKEYNHEAMNEQYKKGYLPYYTFGGGANFNWYHSIISSHNHSFERANIPLLKRQEVILDNIPNNRLIIAEQLTRTTFPEIDGFPWFFKQLFIEQQHIFGGVNRDALYGGLINDFDNDRFRLENIQNEKYGG